MGIGMGDIIPGPNILYELPGFEIDNRRLFLNELPVELKSERLYIDDHGRMPDVILTKGDDKFLCWVHYRDKVNGLFWRIGKVFNGVLNDPFDLYREDPANIFDYSPDDNVAYGCTMLLWPYGVDSYNFSINKINEYPFLIKGSEFLNY